MHKKAPCEDITTYRTRGDLFEVVEENSVKGRKHPWVLLKDSKKVSQTRKFDAICVVIDHLKINRLMLSSRHVQIVARGAGRAFSEGEMKKNLGFATKSELGTLKVTRKYHFHKILCPADMSLGSYD